MSLTLYNLLVKVIMHNDVKAYIKKGFKKEEL